MFDLSKRFKFFDPVNENVINKRKDVHKGKPISKVVGIKSKMHCILLDDGKKFNKGKGVNIAMESNKYKGILFNKKITKHKVRRIQSKKHKIGTYELNKISLSCFDDERFVLDDSVQTIAFFHQDYKKQKDILKNSHI